MTKIELLNKIITITRKTGQGLAGRIIRHSSREMSILLDELIEENLIYAHMERFSTLPDEEWLFPIGCYNLFGDSDKRALTFMRLYLGHDDLGLNVKPIQVLGNVDFMKGYVEWLERNEKSLLDMVNMKDVEDTSDLLSEKEVKWVKKRKWFIENWEISKCLRTSSQTDLDNEQISINERLLVLYNTNKEKYKDKIDESKSDILKIKAGMKMRARINRWLESQDPKAKIQEVLN